MMPLALPTEKATAASDLDPPPPPREFRAAWVATVGNIDWPSKPGLPSPVQQTEAKAILDRALALNLNAIVLQVRPAADALYDSPLEPWSAYLSGVQGKPPEPNYDPLEFWINEAHARGLQLHAWFNPYRARLPGAKHEPSNSHISKTNPEIVKAYGGYLWMDPGEPDAQDQTLKVFLDVARRYDVDGIHIDDYFYPYPVIDPADPAKKRELDFPDEPSWTRYRAGGGKLGRADWRRSNIDQLIEKTYRSLKAERKSVQFGISPFGIPRPGHPPGVKGFDQYARLYADAERWLHEGWCDYYAPQLYWKVDSPGQPFAPLLSYWIRLNAKGRHVWPGLSVSRVNEGPSGYDPGEIVRQIELTRSKEDGAAGNILFSMKPLLNNPRGLVDRLQDGPYQAPALVPRSPWLDNTPPKPPHLHARAERTAVALTLNAGSGEPAFLWAVHARRGSTWTFSVHPAATESLRLKHDGAASVSAVSVRAVDRLGQASKPVTWEAGGP